MPLTLQMIPYVHKIRSNSPYTINITKIKQHTSKINVTLSVYIHTIDM